LANLVTGGVEATTYVAKLRQAIRAFSPDLVHSNGFKMHLLSAYGPASGVPLLWHIHDYVRSRPVTAPLLRLCAPRCSAAVTNSHSVAADLRSLCSPALEIEPVHNGVDIETFAPEGPSLDLDAMTGLPPEPADLVRIGFVGTFARWKGHDIFLRALAMLNPRIPYRGYVVGGPIYETNNSQHSMDDLKKLASALGLSGRVGFTGFIEDTAAAFRSLDIVVHASTEPEPFGLVIVEAMACGKAVVVSNCGGPSEIVQDRVNALTHEPRDIAALAARIEELASNPALRENLGKAARQTTEDRFDRRRFAGEFAKIYRRLASTRN
jgi:glycosyltransferase involved in cell wall biosynthesis